MSRSVKFYRDTLGLPVKYETNEWTEFQTGKTTLALHPAPKPDPASKSSGSGDLIAGSCSIGFNVSDLEKTFRDLESKGVRFVMPPTSREGEEIKLAICLDPDGLAISISEPIRQSGKPEITAESAW